MQVKHDRKNPKYHIGIVTIACVTWNQPEETTKLYGGHGPLNNSFAPPGGRIRRACWRNSSAQVVGVRKYSETMRPWLDDDTSLRWSVEQPESKLTIRSASWASSGARATAEP